MPWAVRTLLLISAVAFPLCLYVALRVAGSIGFLKPGLKRRARRLALLAVGLLYLLPAAFLALRLLGHSGAVTAFVQQGAWVDLLYTYPVWISLIVVLELVAPFLVMDIASLIARFAAPARRGLREILARVRIALAAGLLLYVPVRAYLDTAVVRDTAEEIRITRLHPALDGLRVTLVGDTQADRFTGEGKLGRMQEIVRSGNPQLLVSTGDIVTDGTDHLDEARRAMCGIRGSLASFSVMGDHDHWSAPAAIRSYLVACGWRFLDNRHERIAHGGATILVSGVTHIYSRRMNGGDLDRFLDEAPEADLKILVAHQPAEFLVEMAAARGYHLVLAGHTHGGQIVFHPLGIPLTPSMRESKYYTGVHRLDATTVVTTNGVGLTLAPVRYHAPAEVSRLTLRRLE
jgi:predicted MPP superfamily phosphohydrolase